MTKNEGSVVRWRVVSRKLKKKSDITIELNVIGE